MSSKDFDITKYVGLWYEIAKIPTQFEKECHFATAEYSWNTARKVMNIKNNCLDKQRNFLYSRSGEAKIVNKAQKRLKVTFTDGLPSESSNLDGSSNSDWNKNSNLDGNKGSNSDWNYRILYTDYD